MKAYYSLILLIIIAPFICAQVAIGKESVDGSALLDFVANTNKGIILPWIIETPTAENGSLIYDVSDKKVKVYNGLTWIDLSIKEGAVNTSEIDALEENGNGVAIGNINTTKQGVLILDDHTRALVLPKSDKPWENIKNPEAGTIAYDPNTKLICIFNGLEWTFWGI